VIYNGVPIKPFDKTSAKRKLVREFGLAENEKVILYVGSGFERKGVVELLRLLAKIQSDFKAFIVGHDKRLGRYKNLAKELGLNEKVFFTGKREDVDTFYASSDLFIFPTRYEPFSNVVLEALSFETVVFTTQQNGASEILPSEYVLKTPDDTSVLSTIETLLQDENLLIEEQKKARKLAKKFSIEKNVDLTLQVIEKLIRVNGDSSL